MEADESPRSPGISGVLDSFFEDAGDAREKREEEDDKIKNPPRLEEFDDELPGSSGSPTAAFRAAGFPWEIGSIHSSESAVTEVILSVPEPPQTPSLVQHAKLTSKLLKLAIPVQSFDMNQLKPEARFDMTYAPATLTDVVRDPVLVNSLSVPSISLSTASIDGYSLPMLGTRESSAGSTIRGAEQLLRAGSAIMNSLSSSSSSGSLSRKADLPAPVQQSRGYMLKPMRGSMFTVDVRSTDSLKAKQVIEGIPRGPTPQQINDSLTSVLGLSASASQIQITSSQDAAGLANDDAASESPSEGRRRNSHHSISLSQPRLLPSSPSLNQEQSIDLSSVGGGDFANLGSSSALEMFAHSTDPHHERRMVGGREFNFYRTGGASPQQRSRRAAAADSGIAIGSRSGSKGRRGAGGGGRGIAADLRVKTMLPRKREKAERPSVSQPEAAASSRNPADIAAAAGEAGEAGEGEGWGDENADRPKGSGPLPRITMMNRNRDRLADFYLRVGEAEGEGEGAGEAEGEGERAEGERGDGDADDTLYDASVGSVGSVSVRSGRSRHSQAESSLPTHSAPSNTSAAAAVHVHGQGEGKGEVGGGEGDDDGATHSSGCTDPSVASELPYCIHRRVMGWKLTSQQRRKELVGLLDMLTEMSVRGSRGVTVKKNTDHNKGKSKFKYSLAQELRGLSAPVDEEEEERRRAEETAEARAQAALVTRQATSYSQAVGRMIKARADQPKGKMQMIKVEKQRMRGELPKGEGVAGRVRSSLLMQKDRTGILASIKAALPLTTHEPFLQKQALSRANTPAAGTFEGGGEYQSSGAGWVDDVVGLGEAAWEKEAAEEA